MDNEHEARVDYRMPFNSGENWNQELSENQAELEKIIECGNPAPARQITAVLLSEVLSPKISDVKTQPG